MKTVVLLGLLSVGTVYAKADGSQQRSHTVAGIVKDNTGSPLIGVNVTAVGTAEGAITDTDGKYQVNVSTDGSLVFSYIGYKKMTVPVRNRASIDVIMEEDTQLIGEVVVVGYGTQRKATLTGAVSAVKGSEIVVTKNENVQNMLTGKIPGVRVWQRSSEPGAFDSRFDIRGFGDPLIVIDGITRSMQEFQRLSANDIEDISVLKDGSAAIYGVRAANGVVLVTTKKGKTSGRPEVNYSGSYTLQYPSYLPDVVDVYEYMKIRNWVNQNVKTGKINLTYGDTDIEDFRSGKRKAWDWNKYVLNGSTPETQHTVSITGGSDRTSYYISSGYFYQNSIFKGNDRNYNKYNVLSNIDTKIYDNLTFSLNISAIIDERNEPNEDAAWTIRDYWRMNPIDGPYADVEETMLNQNVTDTENPVSMISSDYIGSRQRQQKWFDGTASLKWDVPGIKGLNLKGLFGYNYNFESYKRYWKKCFEYAAVTTGTQTEYRRGTASRYNIDQFRQEQLNRTQMITQFVLNYTGKFDLHDVGATLVGESMWRNRDNLYAQRELLFQRPTLAAGMAQNQIGNMMTGSGEYYNRNNNALAGRVNYAFADKYLAEFQFRYDGSSNFAPGYQWGFFPSASLAWRVAEEGFFKALFPSVHQFKLRASYGITGDDSAGQYQFMDGFDYPVGNSSPREFSIGYVFNGNWVGSAANKGIPNKYITWYKSKTLNLGVDFEAWKGLFGFTLDYFNRERTGLLERRLGGIPTVVGAQLPQENLNGDRHFGLELELTHRQKLNDLSYKVSAMASITRNQRLDWEERTFNSSRDRWLNGQDHRYQGIYRSDREYVGQFQSWNDIWNYPVQQGSGILPGGYIYMDWNGDGEISGYDNHPVLFDQTPWMNFSFNLSATYKDFDLSVLFQGSALGSFKHGEQIRGESQTLRAMLNRWYPVDPNADPYDPNTQWNVGHYAFNPRADDNSTFNTESINYLRLKNIELGYTLPVRKWAKTRIYVSAYNLLTFSKLKYEDPEHPGFGEPNNAGYYGFMYPLNKTLTFGLTVNF